jgi:hypothetical protein
VNFDSGPPEVQVVWVGAGLYHEAMEFLNHVGREVRGCDATVGGRWSRPSNSSARRTRTDWSTATPSSASARLCSRKAVSIVDMVTVGHFTLYAELLAFVGHRDAT